MKLFLICLTTAILLNSNSCENPPLVDKFYTITIANGLSEPIYFYEASLGAPIQYPDTVLSESKPNAGMIRANSKFYIDSRTKWSEIFKELPSDTLSIFFFDALVYEDVAWEEVRNDYKILKRHDLSIEDLEHLNYIVTYPPTESMKNMKMYPR